MEEEGPEKSREAGEDKGQGVSLFPGVRACCSGDPVDLQ